MTRFTETIHPGDLVRLEGQPDGYRFIVNHLVGENRVSVRGWNNMTVDLTIVMSVNGAMLNRETTEQEK